MSETPTFTLDQVESAMTRDNAFRLRFAKDETGWGFSLGDGFAVIGNTPLAADLHFMDVVRLLEPTECGCCPTAGGVVFRPYPLKSGLTYDVEGMDRDQIQARYAEIAVAIEAAGMRTEGYVAGFCGVNHRDGDDIGAALRAGGVDMAGISVRAWEDYEDKDDD